MKTRGSRIRIEAVVNVLQCLWMISLCVRARVCLSLCVCVRVSVSLCVCACACLSVSLSVRARVCLSLCARVCLSLCRPCCQRRSVRWWSGPASVQWSGWTGRSSGGWSEPLHGTTPSSSCSPRCSSRDSVPSASERASLEQCRNTGVQQWSY